MKTKAAYIFTGMPKKYTALCQVFPPRPIHDDVGYRNTVEVADAFAGFEGRMTADQLDYFELLCELIEKYEAANAKPSKLKGPALLKHLAGEHGLSGAGLSRILGRSASLGPMILRGDRKITADHAVRLGKHFGLRPDLFLG
jgi:antitoxin component HigA of HigAB toxin-antitoxin module